MPAWSPSLRSKTAIRTSPKHHFVDPSIATAVMRINPEAVLRDFEYFGFLFEALCARDMRVYAQRNDGEVFHYRDKSGLEVDLLVQLREPSFLMVLTGGQFAYRRKDGVLTVPIGCLKY
jgi:predicted AAA+ superfamily ATPase